MTTAEAAARLKLSRRAIYYLITSDPPRLKAEKRGRDYWIEDSEVERYARERRGPGQPKRQQGGKQ